MFQLFHLRLSERLKKRAFKKRPPLALTNLGKEESYNLSRVKLASAGEKNQHTMASFTWVGTKKCKVSF